MLLTDAEAVDSEIEFSYKERIGDEVWVGDGLGEGGLKLTMTDSRSWFEKNLKSLIRWTVIALILLLLLGYFPFKKRLPRSLKSKPKINATLRRPGKKPKPAHGQFNKKIASTLIPYKAERGTIRFTPWGVPGTPSLEVKAGSRNTMYITNIKQYAGKDNITINGQSIKKGETKPKIVSAAVMLEVKTDAMTYTCLPNT